tara:strand:+ start:193 stop:867 length:675 start_codon:yes stop_codon:yes gene_type:complete
MKLNLKANTKMLLKSKAVLYIVFFVAITNFFSYLMLENYDGVTLFVLMGFLTSYFSKNMIIVLSSAILFTSLFVGSKIAFTLMGGYKEGMDNDKKENNNEKQDILCVDCDPKDEKCLKDCKEKLTALKPAKVNGDDEESDTDLDYSGTLEAAYDNLDKLLDSDALTKMSSETQNLANKQGKLMNNINKIAPMIENASNMMDKMNGNGVNVDNLMKKMQKMSDKF